MRSALLGDLNGTPPYVQKERHGMAENKCSTGQQSLCDRTAPYTLGVAMHKQGSWAAQHSQAWFESCASIKCSDPQRHGHSHKHNSEGDVSNLSARTHAHDTGNTTAGGTRTEEIGTCLAWKTQTIQEPIHNNDDGAEL